MPTTDPAPDDLQHFLDAQAVDYETALAELTRGRKRTHWIWYVLPQLRGLGSSAESERYGLRSGLHAAAYLAHPVLGPRLQACVAAIGRHGDRTAEAILGPEDALKFRSCLTLFDAVSAGDAEFDAALRRFYRGERCRWTLDRLAAEARAAPGGTRAD